MQQINPWMFYVVIALFLLAMGGWGFTLQRSIKRALLAYQMGLKNGDTAGYARGCIVTLKRMEEMNRPKPKAGRTKKKA